MDTVQKYLNIAYKHFTNKKIINGLEAIDMCENMKCDSFDKKYKIIVSNANLKLAYETFISKFPINTLTENNWLLATKFPKQDTQYNEQYAHVEIKVCYFYEDEKTLWVSPQFYGMLQFMVFKQVDQNVEITFLSYWNTDTY
ncbi:hypothetical protein [Campylobacter troglodytis]|uniref:hypothetical protein n=1 Tax=Campylobacter troglodytis TaxID=654363 RepID=UPI001159F092|nr:hypothetical protein [Campylobacter troglodytis]TQR56579.1 hypothetical protein DMC01_09210 [Campylobacter troglodytis]